MAVDAFVININTTFDIRLHLHFNFENVVLFQYFSLHSYLRLRLFHCRACNVDLRLIVICHLCLHLRHCIILLLLVLSIGIVLFVFDWDVNDFFLVQVANEIDSHLWVCILHLDDVKKVYFFYWLNCRYSKKIIVFTWRCVTGVIVLVLVPIHIIVVAIILVTRLVVHRKAIGLCKIHFSLVKF